MPKEFTNTHRQDVVPEERSSGRNEGVVRSHPAFGCIGASRGQYGGGGTRLYGTDLKHQTTITIRIQTSEEELSLHRAWRSGRKHLIEVELSEAQWASFVSSLNVGEGVPCTLRRRENEPQIVGIADAPLKEKVSEDISKTIASHMTKLNEAMQLVNDMKEGKVGLTKKVVNELWSLMLQGVEYVPGAMEFAAKSLEEHFEKVGTEVRAEIEAHIQVMAMRGLIERNMAPSIAGPSDDVKQIEVQKTESTQT